MSKVWDALQECDGSAVGGNHQESLARSSSGHARDSGAGAASPVQLAKVGPRLGEELDYSALDEVHVHHFHRLDYHSNPSGAAADRFRLLRMRLNPLWDSGKLRSLLITSPLPQDGKTTVSLNLACALSEHGTKRVLVIDADLHHRSVGANLQLSPDVGLAECLHDAVNPQTVIKRVEPLGWYLLQAGKLDLDNPTEVLRPPDFRGMLQQLLPHFDWVLVDSPPVLPLVDALSLSQVADGTLLVARAGQTPTNAVEDAIELIGRKHIVGLVLNGIENANQPYAKYRNYYRAKRPSFAKNEGENDSSDG